MPNIDNNDLAKSNDAKTSLSKEQVESLYKLISGIIDDYDACKLPFIRASILNALKKCLKIAEEDHLARIALFDKAIAAVSKNPHEDLNAIMEEFNFRELEPYCDGPRLHNPECGKMTPITADEYNEIANLSAEPLCDVLSCNSKKDNEDQVVKKISKKTAKRTKRSSSKKDEKPIAEST